MTIHPFTAAIALLATLGTGSAFIYLGVSVNKVARQNAEMEKRADAVLAELDLLQNTLDILDDLRPRIQTETLTCLQEERHHE